MSEDMIGLAFTAAGVETRVTGLSAAAGYVDVTRTTLATGAVLETCAPASLIRPLLAAPTEGDTMTSTTSDPYAGLDPDEAAALARHIAAQGDEAGFTPEQIAAAREIAEGRPPTLTINGYSDDVIELEGAIRTNFADYCPDGTSIALSDGTIVEVSYDGLWAFDVVRVGAGTTAERREATDRVTDHSDRVTLTNAAGFEWAMYGKIARAGVPA